MTIRKSNLVELPKGHLFFHGTSSIFNFTTLRPFSWVAAGSPGQAALAATMYRQLGGKFGRNQPRQGIDRVLVYRAKRPVTLLVRSNRGFVRFAKKHGLKTQRGRSVYNMDYAPFVCKGVKGVADGMSHTFFGGKKLIGGGSFTMLCDPPDVLEYVKMYRPKTPNPSLVYGPLFDPNRAGRTRR